MPDLTVPELISRLTIEAKDHRRLADDLDAKADALKHLHETYNGTYRTRIKRVEPTVDTLIDAIKSTPNIRAVHLAQQFQTPVEVIQRIIDGAKDRIRNKGAGWLEVIEAPAIDVKSLEEDLV